MKLVILYHYFHPDDVISARLFSDLAGGLHEKGWDVEAMPCNRGCRDEGVTYPLAEKWNGITIRRVWRPRFPQTVKLTRLLNAWWMVNAWRRAFTSPGAVAPDIVLAGSDPFLAPLVAPYVRRRMPATRIAYWCHDLYPDILAADGILDRTGRLYGALRSRMQESFEACDFIAGVGESMAEKLEQYVDRAKVHTMTPWALWEPDEVPAPAAVARQEFFGNAQLGLLYSGNYGRAHSCDEILALARELQKDSVRICFSVRGNARAELEKKIRDAGVDVRVGNFADESVLAPRLSAADIHLVSLKAAWTGVVVPSKFFAALAVGRPVIFAGPPDSTVARLIRKHEAGWCLSMESVPAVAAEMRKFLTDMSRLRAMQEKCRRVYRELFSKRRQIDEWDRAFRALVNASR